MRHSNFYFWQCFGDNKYTEQLILESFETFTHAVKTFFRQCSIHAQMIFSTSQNVMQPNLIIVIQKSYSHYLSFK